MDYNTIVNALFMDGDEYNRCTGCGKMTTESKLSSGRCDICSSPTKGLPIAASLDAIVEDVIIEAGILTCSVRKSRRKTSYRFSRRCKHS